MMRDDPVELAAQLASIDSVNPSLVVGAAGESAVAEFVAAWCLDRGLEVSVSEAAPGRPNVVAVRRGSGGGRSLMFNGHLDTVGAAGADTMTVHIDGGRLYGRGVLDMKGGLACALVVAASIDDEELAGDVIVAAVADEEYASIGTDALVECWTPDAAIVIEPTDLQIVADHRGFAVVEVQFTGRASHTSRPDRGANAVHAAARAVAAVVDLDASWRGLHADPSRRPLALVSRIDSGAETFTVPAAGLLVLEVRTTAENHDGQVTQAIDAVLAAGSTDGVTAVAAVVLQRRPLGVGVDHPLTIALVESLRSVSPPDEQVSVGAAPYWTDAALHAEAGTPALVFGPIGEGLHEDVEWVDIASLHRCTAALDALARRWCAAP